MNPPKVSVIIPTYGGAEYLGDAIQSVLDQTYTDFELIVVNDASPDHTDEVVGQFNDPRLKYIRHEKNRGVANARKTGISQSSGELIAHLDQDDLFHPEKIRMHVEFLDKNPEIGFTYNSRFEMFPASGAIREILRPSSNLTLADFVLGFPLAPSVWVQRREWAVRDDIWEERTFYRGREIVICSRLYLAGCKFAIIDRVLNYRRYHNKRVVNNLARQCEAERTCQQIVFDDPRCPSDVLELKDLASSNIYAMWAYVAYVQNEIEIGQEFIKEAVRLNPALVAGTPPALVNDLVVASIDDEGDSHEVVLKRMFENLPSELFQLKEYHQWSVIRGYIMQGVRASLWNRPADASIYFSHVVPSDGLIDESFLQWLISHLLAYETEFGLDSVIQMIEKIASQLLNIGVLNTNRKLKGYYYANRAFENYQQGNYLEAQASALRAFLNYPANLKNNGLLSIILRSMLRAGKKTMRQFLQRENRL